MNTLTLALKGEYFDAIKAGEKLEEYRACTEFWERRIEEKAIDRIVLTRGYPKRDDEGKRMVLPWRGYVIKEITHPHFGPDPVRVYAICVSAVKGAAT